MRYNHVLGGGLFGIAMSGFIIKASAETMLIVTLLSVSIWLTVNVFIGRN